MSHQSKRCKSSQISYRTPTKILVSEKLSQLIENFSHLEQENKDRENAIAQKIDAFCGLYLNDKEKWKTFDDMPELILTVRRFWLEGKIKTADFTERV